MATTPLRNSYVETGKLYFWTATVHNWLPLLASDSYKNIVIDSLQHLSESGKVRVYGFIIMPNHIHLIWSIFSNGSKESTKGSFLKYTAHQFQKQLVNDHSEELNKYWVNTSNKSFEFWQRDPLAIELFTLPVAMQKLEYMHRNPVRDHWQLCKYESDYKYSSASFYETGKSEFGFLFDLSAYFYGT